MSIFNYLFCHVRFVCTDMCNWVWEISQTKTPNLTWKTNNSDKDKLGKKINLYNII